MMEQKATPDAFMLGRLWEKSAMVQVILAEDEHDLRVLLAEFLQSRGLNVCQAADGFEAIELLKAHPDASLLLSDIVMPRMDGFTLVEESLKLHPELKVLMMTAFPTQQPPRSALKAREIRTLVKPFDPDRMCDLVMDMLARP
jgi:two-component system cell cycle sensor histidine kinase/response regulator CckA